MMPTELRTARLVLRPWRAEDAAALHPILSANQDHLQGWIAAHVAELVPVEALAIRLSQFGADFAAGRSFRYAMCDDQTERLLGEADLFLRDREGRVAFPDGDRVEIGYWLDRTATRRGYATEATEALLAASAQHLGRTLAEIRCDERNARSAAIPARLGFTLAAVTADRLQVWQRTMPSAPHRASISM